MPSALLSARVSHPDHGRCRVVAMLPECGAEPHRSSQDAEQARWLRHGDRSLLRGWRLPVSTTWQLRMRMGRKPHTTHHVFSRQSETDEVAVFDAQEEKAKREARAAKFGATLLALTPEAAEAALQVRSGCPTANPDWCWGRAGQWGGATFCAGCFEHRTLQPSVMSCALHSLSRVVLIHP